MTGIELRALVGRDNGYLFVRRAGKGAWELPGGALADEADDADAAMDSLLREICIVSQNIAEDFVETRYLSEGSDGHTVLNLYALQDWMGEPIIPSSHEMRWCTVSEMTTIEMDEAVRGAVLAVFGFGEAADSDDRLFGDLERMMDSLLTGEKPAPLPVAASDDADRYTRHVAGLDVLRTLGATDDPAAAFERMTRGTPELAADIVDFALGEVWSDPALDRRTRSLQVVAMLAALGGRSGPLRSHINGALNHGATPEQVVQTLRMVAVYAGFPVALEAWPIMEDVFKTRGIPRPGSAA